MNLNAIRELAVLTTQAAAALLPLAADGRGADSHGGKLVDPDATLGRALDALRDAGRLAEVIRGGSQTTNRFPE